MEIRRYAFTAGTLLCLVTSAPIASAQVRLRAEAADTLPEDVKLALRSATNVVSVFSISSNEHFAGKVLRADEILFGENAQLILDQVDADWVVIAAKKLKFQSPRKLSRITFAAKQAPSGATGNPGAHGAGGQAGAVGQPGSAGGTVQRPRLYLIVGEVVLQGNDSLQLEVHGIGVDGGSGGTGGRGGNGGRGNDGHNSRSNMLNCTRGASNGDRGGAAGNGGPGGTGGTGGDGVSVMIVSKPAGLEVLGFTRVVNAGGRGGTGGAPGEPGIGGPGGAGGRGSLHCGGANAGPQGNAGARGAPGVVGGDGAKGDYKLVEVADLGTVL